MTPEDARELLATVEGTDEAILQEHMDWKDVADALETIAGLRYEYAVQVPVNGHWEYTKDDQYGPEVSRNHRDATWYSGSRVAAIWADLWDDGEETPALSAVLCRSRR